MPAPTTSAPRKRLAIILGTGVPVLAAGIAVAVTGAGLEQTCPDGPRPRWATTALRSISDERAGQLAPQVAGEVAVRAGESCADVAWGVSPQSAADLELHAVEAELPEKKTSNPETARKDFETRVADELQRDFVPAVADVATTTGSPVLTAAQQVIREHVAQRGVGRPLHIVQITDGIAVETLDGGLELDLRRKTVDPKAIAAAAAVLKADADAVHAPISLHVSGFAAGSRLKRERLESARRSLVEIGRRAGVTVVISRSRVADER